MACCPCQVRRLGLHVQQGLQAAKGEVKPGWQQQHQRPVGKLGAGPEGERQAQRVYATCNGRAVGALCPVWPLQSITMRPCSAELGDTPGASSMAGFNPVDDDACSDSAAVAW